MRADNRAHVAAQAAAAAGRSKARTMSRAKAKRERRRLRQEFAAMVTPEVKQAIRRTELRERMAEASAAIPQAPTVVETTGPATVTITPRGPRPPVEMDDGVEAQVRAFFSDEELFAVGQLFVSGSPYAQRVADAMASRMDGAR